MQVAGSESNAGFAFFRSGPVDGGGDRRFIICYFYAEVGSMVGCEVYG